MRSISHSEKVVTSDFVLEPLDNKRLANLCGQFNQHLRQLEKRFSVEINNRGHVFRVVGQAVAVQSVTQLLNHLYSTAKEETLNPSRVHLFSQEFNHISTLLEKSQMETSCASVNQQPRENDLLESITTEQPQHCVTPLIDERFIHSTVSESAPEGGLFHSEIIREHLEPHFRGNDKNTDAASSNAQVIQSDFTGAEVIIRTRRGVIKGRTPNQRLYLHNIVRHDINFGVGVAGSGKTFLAVACAVEALESEQVRRLVLVRPAVEAGEKLGFLPGDLAQKVDPYLRPLYDALYEMFGLERVGKLIERGVIEIAPLAYMRGRTLNDSFIILDEAQNTTVEQMKMFLTRIGFGSTAVVTGDITQIDLPRDRQSGLRHVIHILQAVKGVSFTFFEANDVVRHPIVARIINAYEKAEQVQKE